MRTNVPPLRTLLVVAVAVVLAGPLFVALVAALVSSTALALAAGLVTALLLGILALAVGWWLTCQTIATLSERLRVQTAEREAACAADQAKGELLATMSHEIRTPM